MSAADMGGPAFPTQQERGPHGDVVEWAQPGMSLRDYFAAKAMQAQVITDMVPGEACDALMEAAAAAGQDPVFRLALTSYEIADAMLRARSA